MKEKKVTVKHYLNTNLKPTIIKGEKYYPIYILIYGASKSTKVKSLQFTEEFTETMFLEIENDSEGKQLIEDEQFAIKKLFQTMLFVWNGNFDANLFVALYNSLNSFRAAFNNDMNHHFDFNAINLDPNNQNAGDGFFHFLNVQKEKENGNFYYTAWDMFKPLYNQNIILPFCKESNISENLFYGLYVLSYLKPMVRLNPKSKMNKIFTELYIEEFSEPSNSMYALHFENQQTK